MKKPDIISISLEEHPYGGLDPHSQQYYLYGMLYSQGYTHSASDYDEIYMSQSPILGGIPEEFVCQIEHVPSQYPELAQYINDNMEEDFF